MRTPTVEEAAYLIAGSAGLTGLNQQAAVKAIVLLAKVVARETRYAAVDIVGELDLSEADTAVQGRIQNIQLPAETREKPESFAFDLRASVPYELDGMRTALPLVERVVYTAPTDPREVALPLIEERFARYILAYKNENEGRSPIQFT